KGGASSPGGKSAASRRSPTDGAAGVGGNKSPPPYQIHTCMNAYGLYLHNRELLGPRVDSLKSRAVAKTTP
ncbi:unnamed protein product, partial [Amoebophrya sp. A25]